MVVERHEDRSVVDVEMVVEDTFMELVEELNSDMLANAILEAGKCGIVLPMTRQSTVQDIAAMITDGFEEAGMEDVASYWRSNFVINGII